MLTDQEFSKPYYVSVGIEVFFKQKGNYDLQLCKVFRDYLSPCQMFSLGGVHLPRSAFYDDGKRELDKLSCLGIKFDYQVAGHSLNSNEVDVVFAPETEVALGLSGGKFFGKSGKSAIDFFEALSTFAIDLQPFSVSALNERLAT